MSSHSHSHDSILTKTPVNGDEAARESIRVTWIGMVLDLVLAGIKAVIGVMFHSHALVADAVHSLSDAATDVMVIVLAKLSRQEPDEEHPYGHERFETMGTVVLGSLLIAVAGAIGWDSVERLFSSSVNVTPGWPVLVAALASVIGKEWIFRYTLAVGKRIHSDLVIANAWHSRSDAASSVVVLVASAGVMFGYAWMDALAAVLVALLIAKVGWDLAWESILQLVDTALSQEDTQRLRNFILQTEGVRNVHCLRSRRMGTGVLLDMHLQVDAAISVSEGHQIGVRVTQLLLVEFPNIRDVTFHIDAEPDTHSDHLDNPDLPTRKEVVSTVRARWADMIDFAEVGPIRLHYLGDKVSVELFLNTPQALKLSDNDANVAALLKHSASDLPWLDRVRLWYGEHS